MTLRKAPSRPEGAEYAVVIAEPITFQMVAVWMRNERDGDDTYEVELGMQRPEDDSENIGFKGTFQFEKQYHRFVVTTKLAPGQKAKSGIMVIRCRIRKLGARKWITQECPVPIEVAIEDSEAAVIESNGKKPRPKPKKRNDS